MDIVLTEHGPGILLPSGKAKLNNFTEVQSTLTLPFTDDILFQLVAQIPSLQGYRLVIQTCQDCRIKLKKRIWFDWNHLRTELPVGAYDSILQGGRV